MERPLPNRQLWSLESPVCKRRTGARESAARTRISPRTPPAVHRTSFAYHSVENDSLNKNGFSVVVKENRLVVALRPRQRDGNLRSLESILSSDGDGLVIQDNVGELVDFVDKRFFEPVEERPLGLIADAMFVANLDLVQSGELQRIVSRCYSCMARSVLTGLMYSFLSVPNTSQ